MNRCAFNKREIVRMACKSGRVKKKREREKKKEKKEKRNRKHLTNVVAGDTLQKKRKSEDI